MRENNTGILDNKYGAEEWARLRNLVLNTDTNSWCKQKYLNLAVGPTIESCVLTLKFLLLIFEIETVDRI